MKNSLKFQLKVKDGSWVIVDPDNVNNSVPFEQAIVDATLIEPGLVEGYIASVHGLSDKVADLCDGATLRALGVGAQLFAQTPPGRIRAKGMRRVRLVANGQIEGIGRA